MKIIPIKDNKLIIGWYPVTKQVNYNISQKEINKMTEICTFFDKKSRLKSFLSVIDPDGDRIVSLRNIEHFLLKMCYYDTNISYPIIKGNLKERFNISQNFNEMFDQETKKYFDIFCRERKVILVYISKVNDDKEYCYLHTSIGQANLFMWMIKWRVLNYIINHRDDIEKSISYFKETSDEKTQEVQIKIEHSPFINTDDCSISLNFSSSVSNSVKKTRNSRKKRGASINLK